MYYHLMCFVNITVYQIQLVPRLPRSTRFKTKTDH